MNETLFWVLLLVLLLLNKAESFVSETGAVKFYTGIKEKGPNESSLRRYDCLLPNSHGYTGKPAFVEVYNSSKLMEFQEDGNMIEYIFNSEEDPNSKIENNQ